MSLTSGTIVLRYINVLAKMCAVGVDKNITRVLKWRISWARIKRFVRTGNTE